MTHTVDYFLAPLSPWTYLGHARFVDIARKAGATVRVRPVDLGRVFPVSGGLPLPQRAPQRQAYRLADLARWRDFLGLPLNLQPKHFPAPAGAASQLIIAVDQADGAAAALQITGALLAAVWAQERDVAAAGTLAALLTECGLPTQRLADSQAPEVQALYAHYTAEAIEAGVFGSPSYVIGGELYWGQDRLDFVERRLALPA